MSWKTNLSILKNIKEKKAMDTKTLTKKVINYMENEYPLYLSRMKQHILNWYGETSVDNKIGDSIKIYQKYNQGSFSFTQTKLKHIGYEYDYELLESIYATLK
jgi:hypothetical protein